jgi:alanine racemase
MFRKTYAEIDLKAIEHNLGEIKKIIGSSVKILLPVKADAYGHGITEVSKFIQETGSADVLGVASIDEGIELRDSGITIPVLVLSLSLSCRDEIEAVIDYKLSQTIASEDEAETIESAAKNKNSSVNVHLKVDTGMGRIGSTPENSLDIIKKISSMKNIRLEGIFSHMPLSDDIDSPFNKAQIKIFSDIVNTAKKEINTEIISHIANSAAILNYKDSFFDMVRPGITVYGFPPAPDKKNNIDFIPAMTFKSSIIFTKRVLSGTPLSYSHTYKTSADSNIATVAAGYGDGYPRSLSNKSKVIINNKSYPVVGRICMDQFLVNLGNDSYPVGEEVILFGKKLVTAADVAQWANTIPYEITCSVSRRVPRIYIK